MADDIYIASGRPARADLPLWLVYVLMHQLADGDVRQP